MLRPLLATLTAVAAVTALLAGCGSSTSSDAEAPAHSDSASTTAPTSAGEITVCAAASLTESFTTLGKQFEAAHPDARITFSFGPSSGLATQIIEGAPADVFASASDKNMDAVVAARAAETCLLYTSDAADDLLR